MATFTCTQFPNLVVLSAADIQFVGGSFSTEDPRLVGVLRDPLIAGPNGIVESVAEANANVSAAANVDSSADQTNPLNLTAQGL